MNAPLLMSVPRGYEMWWDDGTPDTRRRIPLLDPRPVHTDGGDWNDRGWHARLITENGVHVDLTYDPEGSSEYEESVSMWLYVDHPQDGRLIPAHAVVEGELVFCAYSPNCAGVYQGVADCQPGRSICDHERAQWWTYVSGPSEIMALLGWLGSMRIRAEA